MAKPKGGNVKIEWYGFRELLDKIEKVGGKVDKIVVDALKKSAQPVKKDMLDFMEAHSPGGSEASVWASGDTLKSWNDGKITKRGDTIYYKFGFSIRDGGLPAIFLNYGGFYTRPYLFLERAIDDNLAKVKEIQALVLQEIFEELKGKK